MYQSDHQRATKQPSRRSKLAAKTRLIDASIDIGKNSNNSNFESHKMMSASVDMQGQTRLGKLVYISFKVDVYYILHILSFLRMLPPARLSFEKLA